MDSRACLLIPVLAAALSLSFADSRPSPAGDWLPSLAEFPRPPRYAGPLRPKPWVEDFDRIWDITRRTFYDPTFRGMDWDAVRARYRPRVESAGDWDEASALINRMLGELGSSHTGYFRPDQFAYWFYASLFFGPDVVEGSRSTAMARARFPDGFACPTIGLFTVPLDGGLFVSGVMDGGPAARAGVLVGDRIVSADGGPWAEVTSFTSKVGQPVTLRVQRTDLPPRFLDLTVTPQRLDPVRLLLDATIHSARVLRAGGCQVAYVRPWFLGPGAPGEQLQLARADIRSADALVLDLREGYGGLVEGFLDVLAPGPGPWSEPSDSRWHKPVALVVNGRTRSGKEILADSFRRRRSGPIVGEHTQGAVLVARAWPIGEDGLLELPVSEGVTEGTPLERFGVEPDLVVPFDIRYAAGRDPQLDRAVETVISGLLCAPRPSVETTGLTAAATRP